MMDDTSRRLVAVAVSLAFHVVSIALLANQTVVQLRVEPTSVLLTFVEVADRTAGPGAPAAELKVAAPVAAPVQAPAAEPEIAAPPAEVARDPVPEPVPKPTPERVPVPAPRAKPTEDRKVAAKKPVPVPVQPHAGGEPGAAGSSPLATNSRGTDTRSTAPEWAPSARLRYEEMLFAWMNRHKQYPLLAQRRGLEGSGSVRIRIDRDGRVLERSVQKSTGEPMLDQAALDMVRRASPFPPVPAEYGGSGFEFVAPIQYRLR